MSDSATIFSQKVERLTLSADKVTKYFSQDKTPDMYDTIIYVRERFPDPRQQVVVKADYPLSVKSLANYLIFVEGETDDQVSDLPKLGQDCYCLVYIDKDNLEHDDCGIPAIISEFSSSYSVSQFDALVYSDSHKALEQAWEFTQSSRFGGISYRFPHSFTSQLQIMDDGVDVSIYSAKLAAAKRKNELNVETINSVVKELRAEVEAGKTAIQTREDSRSLYSQWLTLLITQEFNLPPVYISSYIAEYTELHVAYPFEKLSMYERVMFLRNLPEYVGYIGNNTVSRSMFICKLKVFPQPAAVFNISRKVMMPEMIESFDLATQEIIDYRAFFRGSANYFSTASVGMSANGQSDYDVDRKWSAIFGTMIAVSEEQIFPTIRNTVVFRGPGGDTCIAYFDEPLGVAGILQSRFFGMHAFTIYEEDFHRLIDAKILLALWKQQSANTRQAGNSEFKAVVAKAASTFKPAIPTFLLMCVELASTGSTGLSYFDERLRCDRICVPIVSHSDSKLTPQSSLFDFVSMQNLLEDKYASSALSAFGTVNYRTKFHGKIPVSVDSFRGCALL